MEKQTIITKKAKEILEKKQSEIAAKLAKEPNTSLECDLKEINEILETASVEEEDAPALVKIGSKVVVENLSSGDKREYTLMTRLTANPLSGVISNESPLGQRILGLKLGNTFKFIEGNNGEQTFKIKSID